MLTLASTLVILPLILEVAANLCPGGFNGPWKDNSSCVDINECNLFATCSQYCRNLNGSFECSCADDFQISENATRCTPSDSSWRLVYASYSRDSGYIEHYENGTERRLRNMVKTPVQTVAGFFAVSVNVRGNEIYWSDLHNPGLGLYKSSLLGQGSSEVEVLADSGVGQVFGISVDWITGNIYFVDRLSQVGVCSNGSQNLCSVLIHRNRPVAVSDIAVVPNLGFMVWIEGGNTIAGAGMDGSSVTPLVLLGSFTSLAVDQLNGRLYFSNYTKIVSMLFDGENQVYVPRLNVEKIIGLAILGDMLFVSDRSAREIWRVDKFTKRERRIHLNDTLTQVRRISIAHSSSQPIDRVNNCENANCSHICVLSPVNKDPFFSCVCPAGMRLENDLRKCTESENATKLVVALTNTLKITRLNSTGRDVFESVTLPSVGQINALVYNPINHSVILSDATNKSIYEYDMDTLQLKLLANQDLHSVVKLSIDPVAENLYWIDAGKRNLEVMSLGTRVRAVLLSLTKEEVPTDLLVVLELNALFLAVSTTRLAIIFKILPNGKGRVLVEAGPHAAGPTAISYNGITGNVLWVNQNGGNVHILTPSDNATVKLFHVKFESFNSHVVIHDNYIYWVDHTYGQIQYANFDELSIFERNFKLGNITNEQSVSARMMIMRRDWGDLNQLRLSHDCNKNRCSHICISSGVPSRGECLCPSGQALSPDGKTCHAYHRCARLSQWQCGSGECIHVKSTCDGKKDCSDCSDETYEVCPFVSRRKIHDDCAGLTFSCRNGSFISVTRLCDGTLDCDGGEDEDDEYCVDHSLRLNTTTFGNQSYYGGGSTKAEGGTSLITVLATAVTATGVTILLTVLILYFMWFRKRLRIMSREELYEFFHGVKTTESLDGPDELHIFGEKYDQDKYEFNEWEFSSDGREVIGAGNFGLVYKSKMDRFGREVAIKTVKTATTEDKVIAVRTMLREIKIMSYVGEHPNVVTFLGAFTKKVEEGSVMIATELCDGGSLLTHLRELGKHKENAELYDLYRFCGQIANGMQFLKEKRVIHGDLSAKNVLLDGVHTCKISDFGLSRTIERYDLYKMKTFEPLPWPWMAVESLDNLEFSFKTDVWSLGVTYWEIFTLGRHPYIGLNWDLEFTQKLRNGLRLPRPELVTDTVYEKILSCFEIDPVCRPNVRDLYDFFQQLMGIRYEVLS